MGDDARLLSGISKGWKSSMPRAEMYRFYPLDSFKVPLDCLQELPRVGNRGCHAPKRADSVPWGFLRDDAGLPSRTSSGQNSSVPRTQTHRLRALDFFARMTRWTVPKNIEGLEIGHATRPNAQIPPPGTFCADDALGRLQKHRRAGNRACHAPKRADSNPWRVSSRRR